MRGALVEAIMWIVVLFTVWPATMIAVVGLLTVKSGLTQKQAAAIAAPIAFVVTIIVLNLLGLEGEFSFGRIE